MSTATLRAYLRVRKTPGPALLPSLATMVRMARVACVWDALDSLQHRLVDEAERVAADDGAELKLVVRYSKILGAILHVHYFANTLTYQLTPLPQGEPTS